MTDENSRREPADDDAMADSFDIDETAAENPPPRASANVPPANPPVEMNKTPTDESAGRSNAAGEPRGRGRRRKRRKAPWWELPALIALAILIAILVKTFLVQPFYIPSESMEKTLHGCPGCSGDRILVNKLVYDFRDPHPGDIVVFNAPPGWDDEPPSVPPGNPVLRAIRGFGQLIGFVPPDGMVLVKRVIAVGGQSVKGNSAGDVFVSNSGVHGPWRKLDETYVYETGTDPRAKFGPVTVPKGRLWVMGDHRDRSADSRYHCGQGGNDGPDNSTCNVTSATVPINDVIGKAFVIAWPPSRWTTLGTPKTFTSDAGALAGSGVLPILVVGPLTWFVRRRRRRR
jgi:signal peptidase I